MATEQIIHPILAPPNAPKYYYPGFYYYTPEPYHTTHIPKHHHHVVPPPLKHAVHDFVHPFGDGYQVPAPPCDIRETKTAYYLDVELPGLRDKGGVRLRWTGTRSLFVDAKIQRDKLPDGEEAKKEGGVAAAATAAVAAPGGVVQEGKVTPSPAEADQEGPSSSSSSSSSESDKKKKKKSKGKGKKKSTKKEEKKVHFLKKERKIGEMARAFNFPVDVDQDKTVAKLAYGVLSVVVPKKVKHAEEEEGQRNIEIEYAGH